MPRAPCQREEKSLPRVMISALNFELFWQAPRHLSRCVLELNGLACIGASSDGPIT